jgi:hypothetical membrane protein
VLFAALSLPRRATATHVGVTMAAVLLSGIGASALTTSDPLWWLNAFSRLGEFRNFSGDVFNITIIVAAGLIVWFGARIGFELKQHQGTAVLPSLRAAGTVRVLIILMGGFLALVGFFPQNLNPLVHGFGPPGAVLLFVALLISRRRLLRGMHRIVARTTQGVGSIIGVSTGGFIAGFINLALFELIVFTFMFVWMLVLSHNVGRPSTTAEPRDVPSAERPARHVVARGVPAPVARRSRGVRLAIAATSRAQRGVPRTHPSVTARGAHAPGRKNTSRALTPERRL